MYFILVIVLFQALNAYLPQKVIICGVCKNVEHRVKYSIKIMEKIGALFSDYRIVVYENNSTDKTPRILKKWQEKNNKVKVYSEVLSQDQLEAAMINRMEHNKIFPPEAIARARNIVLKKAHSSRYDGFDYIIWMDMDFKREPNYQGFIEVFTSNREWDAVSAYGIDPENTYWDWYALRDQNCPLGSELLGNDWWYLPRNKKFLTPHDDWYPVYSAFGGCCIYKKEATKNCRYSALVTQDLATFYKKIIAEQPTHAIVCRYKDMLGTLSPVIEISKRNLLTDIRNPTAGIKISEIPEIIWRMSSFVNKYPSVCEHVTFHASMIVHGYDKHYINPRLLFNYGG